jgi:hypothetical protein
MIAKAKKSLERFKRFEPGKRFQAFHREQEKQSVGVRILFFVLAFVSFAVGVVLAFIPGPAVLFFALTGALLATQSAGVAKLLDRGEVKGRSWFEALKSWWRRRHPPAPPREPRRSNH